MSKKTVYFCNRCKNPISEGDKITVERGSNHELITLFNSVVNGLSIFEVFHAEPGEDLHFCSHCREIMKTHKNWNVFSNGHIGG